MWARVCDTNARGLVDPRTKCNGANQISCREDRFRNVFGEQRLKIARKLIRLYPTACTSAQIHQ